MLYQIVPYSPPVKTLSGCRAEDKTSPNELEVRDGQ